MRTCNWAGQPATDQPLHPPQEYICEEFSGTTLGCVSVPPVTGHERQLLVGTVHFTASLLVQGKLEKEVAGLDTSKLVVRGGTQGPAELPVGPAAVHVAVCESSPARMWIMCATLCWRV